MVAPRRVLLTPVGSHGDVLPFLGLGRALAARGHEVVLVTAAPFAGAAARAGLGFRATISAEEYDQITQDPGMWDARRGLALVLGILGEGARVLHAALEDLHAPGRTVVVGHTIAWGARLFEERHGLPSLTVHLAPSAIRTAHEVVVAPGVALTSWPVWTKRALWWLLDRLVIDRHACPGLNAVRRELGLPPVRRPFRAWLNSPQGVLCLFPAWFGAPCPDWPAPVTQAGFPLSEDAGDEPAGPALEAFLAGGPPPVVVTPGSANRHARRLFEDALAACGRLGRRALLLSRYAEHVPAPLPAWAHHAPWAPLGQVLPRAAALVHHGGVGTLAQAFAAGVPQLVVPFGFDQPDNATRVARLGVGGWAKPGDRRRLEARLGAALADPAVAAACARWRGETEEGAGGRAALERAADAVEAVATRA